MPETPLEKALKVNQEKLDSIGRGLKKKFDETEQRRQTFREEEWLEDLRQLKRIYDPTVKSKIKPGKSTVFAGYTRSKVQPTVAKLNDIIFPANDKNYSVSPRQDPQLTEEQVVEVVASFPDVDEDFTEEDFEEAVNAYAKDKAERMGRVMDDQLLDLKYVQKGKAMIRSGVVFGTGIMKGPLSKVRISTKTVKDGDKFVDKEKKEFNPFIDNVSLWTWFPDMTSTDLEGCDFVFELHSMTKHEVRNLGKKKHFKKDVINEYIREHKKGDYKLRNWEIDLKTLKEDESAQDVTNKFEVLEYNGYLDGQDLIEIGVIPEDEDPNKDWFVNVWLLGGHVIKAIVHPVESLIDLYHVFYYEKDESSIFGEGLPRIIRDTQTSINSAVRAMLDNAAWVAGPIGERNLDLISEDEDGDDFYPGKMFDREGRGAEAQYPAIRMFNINAHTEQYLAIIEKFERIGDMESASPAQFFAESARTTNETSKGVSIRASTMNLTTNDIVKNFDDANESFLKALYAWNMEFNPDETIKGDLKIKAIGASTLLTKEVSTQNLEIFSQGLTPEDKPYVKRRPLIKKRMINLDLDTDEILNTEAEAQENIQRGIDSDLIQLEKDKLVAEIRDRNAKAGNMEAKAEKTTAEIPISKLDALISSLTELKELKNGKDEGDEGAASTAG